MKADLHVHSVFSDGSCTIPQLIGLAKEKGLDAIAVTDHDTIEHLPQIPAVEGILTLGGVEISAQHRKTGIKAHILGYNLKRPETIAALTQPLLEARSRNSEKQADILRKNGYNIDMSRIARAGGKYLYKQHIMEWLVATGQVHELFGQFYEETFKNGGPCAFDVEYINVFDAVKAVKEAGGLAVLAHPGEQQNFCFIPELAKTGLDGLELNHPKNSEGDREIIRSLAREHGLFLTGGSDCHGKYATRPVQVGECLSDESGALVICRERTPHFDFGK
ncbi:MAG: PHP domain-containing protein [Clostridiales bacterium]|nr:PHP domain-containing protein [Clostridiales bacterium]